MKQTLSALLLLASAFTPGLAQAKAVEDVTFGADSADVIITVLSDEALHAPSVRTYSGLVRIRFYDADDLPTLRFDGDGKAVRVVELGRGSDKSAALNIALGDKTKLALSDVRVERGEDKTVIRIARGLLPALGKAASKALAKAPAVAPVAAPTPTPTAAPAPVAVAPVSTPVAQAPSAAEAPAKSAKPVFTNAKKEDEKPGLKLANDQSSTMPMLLAISALLAVAYGALRLFLNKKASTDELPAIDVVAQKRLGPRHQLVIVRAFDRDYLLSIQGGQTTVVARSSRRDLADADEMLSTIARRTQTSKPPRASGRDLLEDDEPTFGGALFKQALEQRERAREQTAGFRLEAARAQARAELAQSEDERTPSEPVEVRNDPTVESSTDSISDSVSGLLRLRRKAGR